MCSQQRSTRYASARTTAYGFVTVVDCQSPKHATLRDSLLKVLWRGDRARDRRAWVGSGKSLPPSYKFDDDNAFADCRRNRREARRCWLPVDANRACFAKARATAESCAGHAQDIPQRPCEWHVVGNSIVARFSVYVKGEHYHSLARLDSSHPMLCACRVQFGNTEIMQICRISFKIGPESALAACLHPVLRV